MIVIKKVTIPKMIMITTKIITMVLVTVMVITIILTTIMMIINETINTII